MKPNIVPAFIHPKANYIFVQLAGFDSKGLPVVNWAAGLLTEGSDAVPAKGTPGHEGYVAEVPAVVDSLVTHRTGSYTLSKSEWDSWSSNKDDIEYVRSLVAASLSLKLL